MFAYFLRKYRALVPVDALLQSFFYLPVNIFVEKRTAFSISSEIRLQWIFFILFVTKYYFADWWNFWSYMPYLEKKIDLNLTLIMIITSKPSANKNIRILLFLEKVVWSIRVVQSNIAQILYLDSLFVFWSWFWKTF